MLLLLGNLVKGDEEEEEEEHKEEEEEGQNVTLEWERGLVLLSDIFFTTFYR